MKNYIDIHCHILPGLDDGSKDMAMTEAMLRMAYDEGIRKIIATPHNYANHKSASATKILETISKVNAFARENDIGIEIYPGNEIFYRRGVGELLEAGEILTMAGSETVLVEFYPEAEWSYLRSGIQELQQYGYDIILAHCERYDCLYKKKERLEELVKSGVSLQVNASSFLGKLGDVWRKRSRDLLKKDMIGYIGTDSHNLTSRPPRLEACATFLKKKAGTERADRLLYFHAEKLIREGND